jgi:hypothetical protein
MTWIGIFICVSQSAMFSGLNLAVFSVSRMRLEVEASGGSESARRVLLLRGDPNFALTTILWGNVGINVLLTLLSGSVMAGVTAFLFSTFVITIMGEITPQAYFSRNALKMASLLAPVLRVYQVLLYPVAKPSAMALDAWLGREDIQYFREAGLKEVIRRHMLAKDTEIGFEEAVGAMNFFTIDDLPIVSEGAPVDEKSILSVPFANGRPQFPPFESDPDDPFVRGLVASRKRWVVICDEKGEPALMLDVDGFLRQALFEEGPCDILEFCHRPVVVTNRAIPLGKALVHLRFKPDVEDHIIEDDIILVWGEERRIITGSDILGRLLHGIAIAEHSRAL